MKQSKKRRSIPRKKIYIGNLKGKIITNWKTFSKKISSKFLVELQRAINRFFFDMKLSVGNFEKRVYVQMISTQAYKMIPTKTIPTKIIPT